MRKIVKRDNRKKAFLGAIIGGITSIAGSAIGAAKNVKLKENNYDNNKLSKIKMMLKLKLKPLLLLLPIKIM